MNVAGDDNIKELHLDKLVFSNAVAPKESKNHDSRNIAALKIQKTWKKYYNLRIYYFYRDLIKVREKMDPFQMIKYINPKEARIIDRSLGLHIRFRLGGVRHYPIH